MSKLILIVEDNKDILENILLMLNLNGYETISAVNGNEALKFLYESKKNPDIIVSDIMMPKMDGYDFFKEISKSQRWFNTPFIFLSAKANPEDIKLGKLLGADDYITKPFKEEDLLASIAGKIRRKEQLNSINDKISILLDDLLFKREGEKLKNHSNQNNKFSLFYGSYDNKSGFKIINTYPKGWSINISIQNLGLQIFQVSKGLYEIEKDKNFQTLLIKLSTIQRYAFIYFSRGEDNETLATKHPNSMLCFIAPMISYFDSLFLKNIFKKVINEEDNFKNWDIKKDFSLILDHFSEI